MERNFDTFSDDPCGDLEVTGLWITEQENLIIHYRYTLAGNEVARAVVPYFIDLPRRPPTDLGSVWD